MANNERSTSTQLEGLAMQLDWDFAIKMAGCDVHGTPVPEITPQMLEQAQLLARICDLEIEFRNVPEGKRAKRTFALLVHSLLGRAEARIDDCE